MRKQKKVTKLKRARVLLSKNSITNRRSTSNLQVWVAVAWIDAAGSRAQPGANEAIPVFAVSVHERYPTTRRDRFQLLQEIASRMRCYVPEGMPSLWVFPGGFFGFDAFRCRWLSLGKTELCAIKTRLATILTKFPPGAKVAIGVDTGNRGIQEAWIVSLNMRRQLQKIAIQRGVTDLPGRAVNIGPVQAAFFICGEFTGSKTPANGPYHKNHYLEDPVADLSHCRLLVDLAHHRVRHTINSSPDRPMYALVHQRQMERFSRHGAAILTHHHGGERAGKDKHQKTDCCNNWIVFKGGRWLKEAAVMPIRIPLNSMSRRRVFTS